MLYIKFNDKPIIESDVDEPGIILDYAKDGSVVGILILNASSKMSQPNVLEHEVA